jgi:hypothetical protein
MDEVIKILKIRNLIPVRIDCKLNGEEKEVYAYIDYEMQSITGLDEIPVPVPDFLEAVKVFIKQQESIEFDIPQEVVQQYKKGSAFSVNDFIDDNLSVQLKKKEN